ncbi:MAG: hypothetical protein Q8P41_22070 [Pseudomonadota bacterium]|nr:hypothetical protein [Pseudomonadota bacterium]
MGTSKKTPTPAPKATPQATAAQESTREPSLLDPVMRPSLMGMQKSGGGGNSMVRDWVAQQHQGTYDRQFGTKDQGENYNVSRGQLTFDAEGTEGGRYHSRTAHRPPGASGVTIGRGYDVGQHSHEKTVADFVAAGIDPAQAEAYAQAAGKKGESAATWLAANKDALAEVSPEQQKKLFETTYGEMSADVQRISDKPDTQAAYGDVDLKKADPTVRDTLVDLRYRGDYTTSSRKRVQELSADNDVAGLATVMNDRDQWANVPPDRFARRAAYATQGAEELQAQSNLLYTFAAPFEQVGNPNLGLDGRPVKKAEEEQAP